MKKNLFLIMLLLTTTSIQAQYKKASFFNKTGRIYDIGANMHVQSGERKSYTGFFMSFGKQNGDKHISHWYDMELTLPIKYEYKSTASNQGTPGEITVTGKSPLGYSFRYNFVYFFNLEEDGEGTKLFPFVNLTLGYAGTGTSTDNFTTSPSGLYPDKYPVGVEGSLVYGGGAGIVYMFSDKVGVRLTGAYHGLLNDRTNISNEAFLPFSSHPSVQLALRFRMLSE